MSSKLPLSLLSPAGSTAGQSLISTGSSTIPTWATQTASMIGGGAQIVNSISALRGLSKNSPSLYAFATGYYAANDGGGGWYVYTASDTTSADNGGSIIVASDGSRWYLVQTTPIKARQFGVKADGVTNDYASLSNAIASLPTWGGTIDCRDCQTILINQTLTIGNGTSTTASTTNGVILLGAGGDDPFGNVGSTLKLGVSSSAVVQFLGPILGGGLQGNWIIDGNSLSTNGIVINQVADGDFGNISIKNCTNYFALLTNQNATDPYGGCRNNQFKSLSIPNVPTGATGLALVAQITTSAGDIIQNKFGIVDMGLSTNGETGIQLGWADFNVFDAVDISAVAGGTSIGMLLKGNDSSHVPFNNTFNCFASSCPISTFTGQIPYGNIILNYDFIDSNHVLPSAIGICGTAQYIAAGTLFSSTFGYAAYGWNNGTPSIPSGTGSGNYVQNTNAYPVTIYQTGGLGVHLVDTHSNDLQIGGMATYRLLQGEKTYFATTIPTSWAWHADVF